MDHFEGVLIEEEKGCQIVKLPINSSKQNMQNKKCNYKTLAIMTLYSNMTPNEITLEQGYEELYRFVYENKIKNNIIEIENLSHYKQDTIIRNIRKLAKLNKGLITVVNSPKGIVYYINYRSEKGGDFVTIEEDILKYLIDTGNSNVIKVYILLKYLCRNGKRAVTNEYIAEQIGLNKNSHKNIQSVINIIKSLVNNKLIKKYKNNGLTFYDENDNKYKYKTINEYELISYNKWKEEIKKI